MILQDPCSDLRRNFGVLLVVVFNEKSEMGYTASLFSRMKDKQFMEVLVVSNYLVSLCCYVTALVPPYILIRGSDIFARFEVKGYVTGFGNPDWERTHEAAGKTAVVVTALLKNGAKCVGKTVMDELAFG